jgi:hypothetical protein
LAPLEKRQKWACHQLNYSIKLFQFVCLIGWFVQSTLLAGKGLRYETLGISELHNYQIIRILPASDVIALPLTPNVL